MFHLTLLKDLELFEKFLEFQFLSEQTIKSYISDIKKSFEYIKNIKNLNQLTLNDIHKCSINDWRGLFFHLQKSNLSERTQERYLISLKSYSKFKKKSQNIELSIEKLKNFKLKTKNKIIQFSKEDIAQFLYCFKNPKTINEIRNEALVYLLYSIGLRINEALNLKHENLFDKYIRINGKGNKIRMVPFFPKVKKLLQNYINQTKQYKKRYIFLSNNYQTKWHACSVARLFKETCIKQNLKQIHPHILRHACATHLLEAKCNLRSIQALLGHSSLEITKRYINFSNEDLKKSFFAINL